MVSKQQILSVARSSSSSASLSTSSSSSSSPEPSGPAAWLGGILGTRKALDTSQWVPSIDYDLDFEGFWDKRDVIDRIVTEICEDWTALAVERAPVSPALRFGTIDDLGFFDNEMNLAQYDGPPNAKRLRAEKSQAKSKQFARLLVLRIQRDLQPAYFQPIKRTKSSAAAPTPHRAASSATSSQQRPAAAARSRAIVRAQTSTAPPSSVANASSAAADHRRKKRGSIPLERHLANAGQRIGGSVRQRMRSPRKAATAAFPTPTSAENSGRRRKSADASTAVDSAASDAKPSGGGGSGGSPEKDVVTSLSSYSEKSPPVVLRGKSSRRSLSTQLESSAVASSHGDGTDSPNFYDSSDTDEDGDMAMASAPVTNYVADVSGDSSKPSGRSEEDSSKASRTIKDADGVTDGSTGSSKGLHKNGNGVSLSKEHLAVKEAALERPRSFSGSSFASSLSGDAPPPPGGTGDAEEKNTPGGTGQAAADHSRSTSQRRRARAESTESSRSVNSVYSVDSSRHSRSTAPSKASTAAAPSSKNSNHHHHRHHSVAAVPSAAAHSGSGHPEELTDDGRIRERALAADAAQIPTRVNRSDVSRGEKDTLWFLYSTGI